MWTVVTAEALVPNILVPRFRHSNIIFIRKEVDESGPAIALCRSRVDQLVTINSTSSADSFFTELGSYIPRNLVPNQKSCLATLSSHQCSLPLERQKSKHLSSKIEALLRNRSTFAEMSGPRCPLQPWNPMTQPLVAIPMPEAISYASPYLF